MSGYDFVLYCSGIAILTVSGCLAYVVHKGWQDGGMQ